MAAGWCSNAVRLQVFQNGLINSRTYAVNRTFLADVEADVTLAESLGLVAEVNDQSEGAGKQNEYTAFLRYLAAHGMGLTAWTLTAGVLVTSKDLTSPTQVRANWACRDGLDEGPGSQIMHWFAKHN